MTVRVSKPEFNLREKLSELDKPTGLKGSELMRSDTSQDARDLIGAGRKNKIINGAMLVSQRATSKADVNAGYHTVDRMRISKNSLGTTEITHEQSTDSPNGFAKSLKLTVTTAKGSIGTADGYRPLHYRIEGQDVQDLAYGTSDAKSLTLSFHVKSSVTGTYSLSFRNITAGTYRLRSTTYTIDSANTWEKKIITIEGDTSTAIINDNATRFEIYWCGGTGTDFNSSSDSSSGWANYASGGLHYGQIVQLHNTLNSTFLLTGIQLEIGKNATEFEHRSLGEELALCQRYYIQYGPDGGLGRFPMMGECTGVGVAQYPLQFPVVMRGGGNVSLTTNGSSTDYNIYSANQTKPASSITLAASFKNGYGDVWGCRVNFNRSSNDLTVGRAAQGYAASTSILGFSREL